MEAGILFLPVLRVSVDDCTTLLIQPNLLFRRPRHTAGFNFPASFSV